MDWANQTQDMFKSWFDVQRQTWEGWFQAVRQDIEKSEPGKAWSDTIDAWQASVKGTLNAQLEGSRIWADSLTSVHGAPKGTDEWAKHVQDMAENWAEMQGRLWDNWFEVARKADPSKFVDSSNDGSGMLKTWQEMAQKAIDSQSEWMRSVTSTAIKKES